MDRQQGDEWKRNEALCHRLGRKNWWIGSRVMDNSTANNALESVSPLEAKNTLESGSTCPKHECIPMVSDFIATNTGQWVLV